LSRLITRFPVHGIANAEYLEVSVSLITAVFVFKVSRSLLISKIDNIVVQPAWVSSPKMREIFSQWDM
jgi:hypothetical protein